MKILVLDDDKDLLSVLKELLTGRGHTVDCVESAAAAIEPVERNAYEFVLVDYMLRENDGVWFMQNARIPRGTRVLLMTAYVNRDVINRMFALGAAGYIIKPFDENELFKHIDFFSR